MQELQPYDERVDYAGYGLWILAVLLVIALYGAVVVLTLSL